MDRKSNKDVVDSHGTDGGGARCEMGGVSPGDPNSPVPTGGRLWPRLSRHDKSESSLLPRVLSGRVELASVCDPCDRLLQPDRTDRSSATSPVRSRAFLCSLKAAGRPSHFELTLGTDAGIVARDTPERPPVTGRPISRAAMAASSRWACSYRSKACREGSLTLRKPSTAVLFCRTMRWAALDSSDGRARTLSHVRGESGGEVGAVVRLKPVLRVETVLAECRRASSSRRMDGWWEGSRSGPG